ncbi:MAG: hypothetical protein ACT4P3_02405 [Betaproteobacteria bacterium]
MRLLAAACAALAAGCAAAPAPGRGGDVQVVWMRVEDPQRVCQGLAGRKEFLAIHGCSRWSAERRRCEIYAPEPRSERDLQRFATLGHELLHCFDGSWHDRWGRMPDKKDAYAVRRIDPRPE